jgi:Concanavalin A-like lectin/glucanases superfamily
MLVANAIGPALRGGSGYSSAVLADSPAGYWPLNESSGTTAFDLSGNGNNGTYSGSFTVGNAGLLLGTADTCANFTGGKMVVPDVAPLRLGAGNISIECWINVSSLAAYASLFDAGSSATNRFYSCFLNASGGAGTWYGAFGGTAGHDTLPLSPSIAIGTLYYIAITSNGTTQIAYVNTTASSTNLATAGASNDNLGVTLFGNPSTGGGLLQGKCQEFAIYPTVLSAARVTAHYNAGTTASASSLAIPGPAGAAPAVMRSSVI